MKNTTLPQAMARRAALAGFSMIALSGLALQAEEIDNNGALPAPQAGPTAAKNPPTTLSTGLAEQFNTGVASGGTMSITRFQAGVVAPFRLTDALVVSTSFKYGLDIYDFRSVQPQWRGPWHNINTYTLATIVQGTIDDQWSVYGGGLVRESGETGAEFGEGFTGGGLIGVNYKYSDTLSFGGGLGLMSQLEDHAAVLPLITANWKFADAWHLKVGLTDVATTGYGAEVIYDVTSDWQLAFGLQHEKSRFRIEGANLTQDGIGQEESSALYTDATWHATPDIDVDGYLGLTVGGNLRVENQHGTGIYSSDYNTAAIIGLKASFRF